MVIHPTGSIVLVKTDVGPKLAVVQARRRRAASSTECRYYVWIDGMSLSISEQAIMESSPACPTCGRTRWYLSEGQELFLLDTVLCAYCHPPRPTWAESWDKLAKLLALIPTDHSSRPSLEGTVSLCDAAFQSGNWPLFKQATYALGMAIALQTGLYNPFDDRA